MKKKTAMILVGGLLICLIGGCGKDESNTVTMESAEETVAEVAEEVEEEVTEAEETNVDETATDESPEVEEESESETEEFPTIRDGALAQDKSDEYGVYSTSCYDLDQFLDSEGRIPEEWDWESKEFSEYSGRFAYPVITPCRFFTDMEIADRSDRSESLYGTDSETGEFISIYIYSGLDRYLDCESYVGQHYDMEDMGDTVVMFTTETSEGETDVLYDWSISSMGEEGSDFYEEMRNNSYTFKVGNFSVSIGTIDYELEEEDLRIMIENISLKR